MFWNLCGLTGMPPTDSNRSRSGLTNLEDSKIGVKNTKSKTEISERNSKANMKKQKVFREQMYLKITLIRTPYHNWRDWLHKARRVKQPSPKEISYCELTPDSMKFFRRRGENNDRLYTEINLSSLISINIKRDAGIQNVIEMYTITGQTIELRMSSKSSSNSFKATIESYLKDPLYEVAMIANITNVKITKGIDVEPTRELQPGTKLVMWTRNEENTCLKTIVIRDFSSRLCEDSVELPRAHLHKWSFDYNSGEYVTGKVWTNELTPLGAISFNISFPDYNKFKNDFLPLLDKRGPGKKVMTKEEASQAFWNNWRENRQQEIRGRSDTTGSNPTPRSRGSHLDKKSPAERHSRSSNLNSTGNQNSYSLNSC